MEETQELAGEAVIPQEKHTKTTSFVNKCSVI